MSLPTGSRLGPYEIIGPLGAGGMGEVYRGRDSRLGRDVAIKVLPDHVAGNPEALSRFEREARSVAALSHAGILSIHDFGLEGGRAYSVTELLEGETLRGRMKGSPLPVRKVLDYGVQIARGLAAAHDKGIVHRDLKPENIFITDDGRAKILDFGLAKVEPGAAGDLTSSPTADHGTRPGTVMGTMGYMSPEQVRGHSVDARSDLFSFGSVLYEMLSGRSAFMRDTAADTMSAILKEDPAALSGSAQEIPLALQRIVEHCLEKSPAERFQSARDLAFHLEAVGSVSSPMVPDSGKIGGALSPRRRLRGAALFATGMIFGGAIGALLVARIWAPAPSLPPTIRYLSYSGRDSEPSASSDGRLIAYTSVHGGRSQIWLKQFPGGDEVALTTGPDDRQPRISPDGSQVLFTRFEGGASSLMRIPVVGGEPRKIVDDAHDGDWSPDGAKVAFVRDRFDSAGLSSILGSVDASGQDAREIATVELARLGYARWSPDGRTIAVVKAGTENAPNLLLLVSVERGEMRTITPPPPAGRLSGPAWIAGGGALLYAQSGSFASSGTDEGASRVVRQEVASERFEIKMWLPATPNVIDVISEGSVVMGVSSQRQNLMEIPLSQGSTSDAQWVTRGNSTDRQPIFSPDGKWVLFSSNRGGNLDLWKLEVAAGTIRRITEDQADDWDPAFTPDGRSILWSSNRSGHFEIWICAADGTGARQLTQDGYDAENPTATRDGRWIVYNSGNPAQSGIWKIHPDGTGATRIIPGTWSTPDVSPGGDYVAFRAGAEPRTLFVARIEDGEILGDPIELPGSVFNGRPRWMPDGRRLLFTATDERAARGIYIQEFIPGQNTIATRRPLLEFVLEESPESYDVSPDGTRLIYSAADTLNSLMLAQGLSGVAPPKRQAP